MRHLLISHRNKHIDRSWGTLLPLDRIVWKEGNTRAAMRRAINIAQSCIEMGPRFYEFNKQSKGIEFMYAKKGYEDRFSKAWQMHKESIKTTQGREPTGDSRKRAREEASAKEPAFCKAQRTEAPQKDSESKEAPHQTLSNKAAEKQGGTASGEAGTRTTAGEAGTRTTAGEAGTGTIQEMAGTNTTAAQARKAPRRGDSRAAGQATIQGSGNEEGATATDAQKREEKREATKLAKKLKEEKIKAVNGAMNVKARYTQAASTANTILMCVEKARPGEAWHCAQGNRAVTKPLEDAKNMMESAVQPRSFLESFIISELSDVEKAYAEETFKTEIAKVPIALTDRIVELERCTARVAKMNREFMAK